MCTMNTLRTGRQTDLGLTSGGSQISCLQSDQTSCGAHATSCRKSSEGSFLGGIKQSGREKDHPPPTCVEFNPLKPELNPICYLLALLGAHHFLHVSRIRVKSLTFRRLMSYIYMEHPFLMFLDHTQRRSTVGRTPLDE